MNSRAVHERLERRDHFAGSSDRSFGLVFAAAFAVIALLPAIFGDGALRWWALVVAALFLAAALVRPSLLAPLNRLWFKLGLLLHRIVNPIVMGLMFFVVITPVAIGMRLAGRDPLRLRPRPDESSYWIDRDPPGPEPDSMSRQF
jgi:hypothetical protein